MLYHLLFPLHQTYIVFNVFRYVTFRTAGAILTGLLFSLLLGPILIRKLRELQVGKSSKGLSVRTKLIWQMIPGLMIGAYLYVMPVDSFTTKLAIPFFKRWMPDLGWAYVLFVALVIVGSSNAVNLTDGLDGLAIGPILMASASYTVLAYVAGHATIARYLQVIFVKGSSELTVFGGAIVGASLGFLWFNAYPAP